MDRLRPYLTVRDIPLWLAAAGVFMLVVTGLSVGIQQPDVFPVVVVIAICWIMALGAGRLALRRMPYVRPARVLVAVVALILAFELGYFGGWYLLPAALSLVLVEVLAPSPAGRTRSAPARGSPPTPSSRASDFDWPDDSPAE
jgi:hypothetical protein